MFESKGNDRTTETLGERFETDRFGVDILMLSLRIPDERFPQDLLPISANHPRFNSLALSKRGGTRDIPGWWRVDYTFEGFTGDKLPEPTYELSTTLSQEPIQTHPRFESHIAGTPSNRLNDSYWVDPTTRLDSEDSTAVFVEFKKGRKAGVDSYMNPGAEWRETSFSKTEPTSFVNIGDIDTPSGNPPDVGDRDWLYWAETYSKRGRIYQITKVWRLSGRAGWDPDIYDSAN